MSMPASVVAQPIFTFINLIDRMGGGVSIKYTETLNPIISWPLRQDFL